MYKYGVISGPYFPEFGLNTGKYGPEITLYLDTFQAVISLQILRKPLDHGNLFETPRSFYELKITIS